MFQSLKVRFPRIPCGWTQIGWAWLPAWVCLSLHAAAQPPSRTIEVPSQAVPLLIAAPIATHGGDSAENAWRLVEAESDGPPVTAQLSPCPADDGQLAAEHRQLLAIVPPRPEGPALRRFAVRPTSADEPHASAFRFQEINDVSLGLWQGDTPVLVYNHGLVTDPDVPERDHRRSRACYLHPVYGIRGEVLTDDFPRDHYHHHGIFWTWPHVRVGDQDHDLWAGASIQQRFVRWLARDTGPVAAVLGVENGWFVGDRQVMIERVWLRAFRPADDRRSLDLSLVLIPTDQPVGLLGAAGKSYGGLTVRFAPPSGKDPHTRITTPEGVAAGDISVTRFPWADFTSRLGGADFSSGAAIFIHPRHPDFPPTWLLRHYGPLCVGWPGVVSRTLPPGQPVRLDYRIWIHPSVAEGAELQAAYAGFQAAAAAEAALHTSRP